MSAHDINAAINAEQAQKKLLAALEKQTALLELIVKEISALRASGDELAKAMTAMARGMGGRQ